MDRGEAQHVCQLVLVQGTAVAAFRTHLHELQTKAEFDQKVRGASKGVAAANADQMLNNHGFVA